MRGRARRCVRAIGRTVGVTTIADDRTDPRIARSDPSRMTISGAGHMPDHRPGVFVSYRREGGAEIARLVGEFLDAHGYEPFIDVDGLRSGHFDRQIIRHIEACRHFVLICSRGAFDRCTSEEDWVRQEIAHAIRIGRAIVPIIVPGFEWPRPSEMPADIAEISRHHAFEYSHVHWRDIRHKLLERLSGSRQAESTHGSRMLPLDSLVGESAILRQLAGDLEKARGEEREPLCWEFIEVSSRFLRQLADAPDFWNARLRCAIEVDSPGIGAPAARRAAKLMSAVPDGHPLRDALFTADRKGWIAPAPRPRDWGAWNKRPHARTAARSDLEAIFQDCMGTLTRRKGHEGRPIPEAIEALKRLCELGFEPAPIMLAGELLDGRYVVRDREAAIACLRQAAGIGDDAAAAGLERLMAGQRL